MAPRRWPLEPLVDELAQPSMKRLALLAGVHTRQVYRWRDNGLSDRQADDVAIRVGLHPALIWTEWID